MGLGDISGKNGSAPLAIISAVIFWLSLIIAIAAQLLLRRLPKPYRRRLSITVMALSPPTVFFEAGFLLSLITVIFLTAFNVNGFLSYIFLFLMLFCLELTALTMGKFRWKDGKFILKTYTRNQH